MNNSTTEYTKTKAALMQLTHEFMEGMVADLNTQYQTTELDNVLML